MNLNGLSTVNIELTNKCNKSCFMCGRRKIEKNYPNLALTYNQEMDLNLLDLISYQIPTKIVIQFHSNGEPLLYSQLGKALDLFPTNIKCLNTNGKLLLEKADEIIDKLDTLTISVIENDPEGAEQYDIIKQFLTLKGSRPPYVIFRLLGNVAPNLYENLGGLICTRTLHNPMGSYAYNRVTTKPEIGVCLDLLNHLVIDVQGNVFPCVRFDYLQHNLLGNIQTKSLEALWNSQKRLDLIKAHIQGNRTTSPLCEQCHFYGCPTSYEGEK